MRQTADHDHSAPRGQEPSQEVGQEEVTQVVHLEHHLLPVLSQGPLGGEHAGVVDQYVHLSLLPSNLPAELPHAGEGGQVTLPHADIC